MERKEQYMKKPNGRNLSKAVEDLMELEKSSRYPLPLRYQIGRISTLLVSSFILICIGGAIHSHSTNIVEQTIKYESNCAGTQMDDYTRQCDTISITINEKISQPVYVYYHITNFWQNHFLYVRSLSEYQVTGEDLSDTEDCEGTKFGGRLDKDSNNKIIVPCGLQAWSHYNDEISVDVKSSSGSTKCTNCLSYDGIALDIDKDRFKSFNASAPNHAGYTSTVEETIWNGQKIRGETTIPDLQDESLMIWMRYAPTPDFKKIHSIINYDLEAGDVVEVSITNRFNTEVFNGKKELILTEAGSFGGKHEFLSIVFILSGVIPFCIVCGILAVHVYLAKQNRNPIW